MAQALICSREALDDIGGIAEYISKDSPYHAEQEVERLVNIGNELTAHSTLG